MSQTLFFHFHSQSKEPETLDSLDACIQKLNGPGFVWIDFKNPTRDQLLPLVKFFGVHPLAIEDCLDEDPIPKLDLYPDHTFFIFNDYIYEGKEIIIDEIDCFISSKFLITVHGHEGRPSFFGEKPEILWNHSFADIKRGTDIFLHRIIDHVSDHKFKAIESIQTEIDYAEGIILEDMDKFSPSDLMHLRSALLISRKSLFHERELFIKFCRKDSPQITPDAIYYFRDIYDQLAKFFEYIEINREMITNLLELYLSLKSNRLAEISNKTNTTMKKLTVITTIFMPLTLIASILGMSEWSMITGPQNWAISYPLFLLGMAGIGFLNYFFLNKKN